MGMQPEEVSYWVAGINHQAWFLQLRRNTYRGEDLYPRLRATMDDPETYAKDSVRFEILRHFDYFVTESSHHMSEYTPWFRALQPTAHASYRNISNAGPKKNTTQGNGSSLQDLDEEARIRQSFMYARHERREDYFANQRRDLERTDSLPFNRTHEYCSFIVHAIETNTPYRFNGNVPNTDLIANLPLGATWKCRFWWTAQAFIRATLATCPLNVRASTAPT